MLTFECTYHRHGVIQRKFTVPAIKRGVSGVYFSGVPYGPCDVSAAAAMPKTLEKAMYRGASFWAPEFSDVMRKDLRGYSRGLNEGADLGTLFAKATWKATRCYLDGFQYGMLKASAVKWSQGIHGIASDCGNVFIRVNSRLAESRLIEAAQSRAIPTFYYD